MHPNPADARSADLATSLTELSALLLSTQDVEEALSHLAQIAVRIIPDGPSCGITVMEDGRPVTIAYEGEISRSVDEAQYGHGDGPCLQAIRTGVPVVAQDLTAERRWGDFPQDALAAGGRGVHAVPLQVEHHVAGALNLYAHESNLFPEHVQRIAQQFADHAAVLLSAVRRHASQTELTEQLETALSSRAVIDQAVGIVMAQRRCNADEAFQMLRKASNDRNMKLRDIAQSFVDSVQDPRAPG